MDSQANYQVRSLHPSDPQDMQNSQYANNDALFYNIPPENRRTPVPQNNYGHQPMDSTSTLGVPDSVSPVPFMKPYMTRTSDQERLLSRTPSPTPSEIEALNGEDGLSLKKIKKLLSPENLFRKDRILYVVLGVAGLVLAILFAVYDKQIVAWFEPITTKIHALPAGFLIPIAILIVLSIPPLFGHDLIEILCGFTYGAGIGFVIVCVGAIIGELINFVGFKYFCTVRGRKLEEKNIKYGCLAQVVRDGGFFVALVMRYSVIPPHFSTAVFATAGMNILVFAAAAALSLPRRFINVYVGYILYQTDEGDESQSQTNKNNLIMRIVLVITIAVTVFSVRFIRGKVNAVKPDVIYRRRKLRQQKLLENPSTDFYDAEGNVAVNVRPVLNVEIPGQPPTGGIVAPQPRNVYYPPEYAPPRYS